ncbi:MAG: glycosyltransferase [Candidatus Binataceae bacterium]
MASAPAQSSAAPQVDPALTTLRVAGVDPEIGFAGGETQVLGLAHELVRSGQRAELICDPRGRLWKRARDEGIVCHPLSIRNGLDFGAALRLRKLLSRERFDIVHFHTSHAHSLAPYLRATAGALVVTRRTDFAPNRLFAPLLFNRAVDGVAAISTAVAGALERSGVRRDHLTLIPSGVDCDFFHPPTDPDRSRAREALGLLAGDLAVGTIGALEPRKGHRQLLDAIAIIRQSRAGATKIRCLIAGDGSLRVALAKRAADPDLAGSVHLLGHLDDVRRLLSALDIFAFPSLAEGLGIAVLEAMACGLPVVASAAGGIGDAVEHERTGVLCRPGDPAVLAAALARLAASVADRRAMGEASRRRAEDQFAMRTMALRTLALYRRCLAKRTGSGKG